MTLPRRQFLFFAAQAALGSGETAARRASALIAEFEKQGDHRTATPADNASGDWLFRHVRALGLQPAREIFHLDRVDIAAATLTLSNRRLTGIPLFDGAFTAPEGIRGRIGPLGSNAPIGLAELVPNQADAGPLGEARRRNQHKAILVTTRGARPGLCPSNADTFLKPYGPPVLQLSGENQDLAGSEATLVASVKRTSATAFNVTASIRGRNSSLAPLIVMTPRSGWWSCASERGGGLVCWLELMRNLKRASLARAIHFVASSGHELGHLGVNAYIENRPGIVRNAHAWIHFGANIGAAQDAGNTVQASDDEMEALEANGILSAGMKVDRRVPRGRAPGGEAGEVHKGGGRYLSLIGANALFHNPLDRGPKAVDPQVISRFAQVFTQIAKSLASG